MSVHTPALTAAIANAGTRPLVVSEVFGPTLQGEGPNAGHPCVFLRTGGCNLSCSWCDTAYTWDWTGTSDLAKAQGGPFVAREELTATDPIDVADRVTQRLRRTDRLVVSGGEPLTQQGALAHTLRIVAAIQRHAGVEIETNGTIAPTDELDAVVDRYNVSPKLAHSGDPEHRRIVPEALVALRDTGKASWKFVISKADDVAAVDALVARLSLDPTDVWLMPLGTHPSSLVGVGDLADTAVSRGYRMTTRLHVLAWGDERGR